MFLRALAAFLALPGVVAIGVPLAMAWRLTRLHPVHSVAGFALVATGFAGLLWCVRDFYVAGKGTLAPWAPPTRLVAVGLYRRSRNPMYLSVLLMLSGWAVAFASPQLLAYALIVAICFQLRVVYGEEPWLARRHGDAWRNYVQRVRRWL